MIENVREAFSGTRGKVLVVAGVGLVGYLVWTRRHTTPDPTAAGLGDVGAVPDDRTRNPQSPPTVGNDLQGGGTAGRPTDAESWISQSVDVLAAPPYNRSATAVYSALRKALDGAQLTTAEAAMVEEAMRAKGTPPGGMPPLNIAAPAQGGQANPPTTNDPPAAPSSPATNTGPSGYAVVRGTNLAQFVDQVAAGQLSGMTAPVPGFELNRLRSLNPTMRIYWKPGTGGGAYGAAWSAAYGDVPYLDNNMTLRIR